MKTGRTVGYIRVSSTDQNTDRQLDGIKLDKVFIDKVSGKNMDRPGITQLMDYVQENDIVLVHSMDRLGRNQIDLLTTIKTLNSKKVTIKFMQQNLILTGDDLSISTLMVGLLSAVAEYQRAMIKEAQREGIKKAIEKGIKFGRITGSLNEKIQKIQPDLVNLFLKNPNLSTVVAGKYFETTYVSVQKILKRNGFKYLGKELGWQKRLT